MSSKATGEPRPKRKWTRVCGRRVKTGCRTCKIRRVKCDEHQPGCFRCQLSGRECDGYEQHQVDRRFRSPSRALSTTSSCSLESSFGSPCINKPDPKIMGISHEGLSPGYFRASTVCDLSGYFDSDFWNRLVLELSHTEPAIKHAVLALEAVHEAYHEVSSSHMKTPGLALQEYNKSITYLKNQLSTPSHQSTVVTLICCLLFAYFECFQYNYDAAILHLASGIEILQSKRHGLDFVSFPGTQYPSPPAEEEMLGLYTRFNSSDTTSQQTPRRLSIEAANSSSKSFQDLEEARRGLQQLMNPTLRLILSHYRNWDKLVSPPVGVEDERSDLLTAIQKWAVEFDAFLKSSKLARLPIRDIQAAFTLIVHQKTIAIMLEMYPYNDSSMKSRYNKEVERVISIASWLARSSSPLPPTLDLSRPSPTYSPSKSPPKPEPVLSFAADMGIIAPMYYLCTKCYWPTPRQHIVDSLSNDGLQRHEDLCNDGVANDAVLPESQDIMKTFEICVADLVDLLGEAKGTCTM